MHIYLTAILLSVMAGISTMLGSFIALRIKKPKFCYLCLGMGFSAGVMIFLGFVELLGESIKEIGFKYAVLFFFLGMLFIYLIDVFVPHVYKGEHNGKYSKKNGKILKLGILVMIGVTIHNFPEGMAVLFSSLANIKFGFAVACAIALHNIPEGIAVSLPIYYATKSKAKAYMATFLSAVAEPIGALLALVVMYRFLSEFILFSLLAAVGGIMVFISFDELLPQALEYKNQHTIIMGLIAGMVLMALSLYVLV
jgi:zinc transporter, ZIP family